jgi:hypothetical protein
MHEIHIYIILGCTFQGLVAVSIMSRVPLNCDLLINFSTFAVYPPVSATTAHGLLTSLLEITTDEDSVISAAGDTSSQEHTHHLVLSLMLRLSTSLKEAGISQ